MRPNRLFVPQSMLDAWLSEERVDVEGDILVTRPEGRRFSLTTAVLFKEEVSGADDPHRLVGRVKDLEQLAEIGAEHYADSVIMGENAYLVVEGFAGEPLMDDAPVDDMAIGDSMSAAALSALGENASAGELDLLAQFLQSR